MYPYNMTSINILWKVYTFCWVKYYVDRSGVGVYASNRPLGWEGVSTPPLDGEDYVMEHYVQMHRIPHSLTVAFPLIHRNLLAAKWTLPTLPRRKYTTGYVAEPIVMMPGEEVE